VLAVVAAFYAVMVPYRINQHSVLWFVHIGSYFTQKADGNPTIERLPPESVYGYDGQHYFYIAADPSHARDYVDAPGVRYARIGYPLVAGVGAGGSTGALPYSLLTVNLVAVLGGTLAVALWLVRNRRSAWFAVLYGLWPGLSFAVFRDLTEPLAYALVACGFLVFDPRRRSRLVASSALFAGALLTRETSIVFPIVLAGALLRHDRTWRRPLAFLAGSLAPVLVWRVFVTAWLGSSTLEEAGGWKVLAPFYGLRAWWPWDDIHWLIVLTVDLPFLALAAGALWLARRRGFAVPLALLLLNIALFVVFIPRTVVIDYGAAGRNAIPALLSAIYCVPLVRSRVALGVSSAVLSPLWFIVVAEALGLFWLDYVSL
jgi:hypothetical protein